MQKINVMKDVLSANEYIAAQNKSLFKKALVVNIMASPGAGKTTFILETIKNLKDKKIVVIEGDVAGDVDAVAIEKAGIPVYQINTGDGCHLNASMIFNVAKNLESETPDLILIENVGNLICPAEFNLGEDYKVVILSIPEGEDKPIKYPTIFQTVDLCILSKIDLSPYTSFNFNEFDKILLKVNPELPYIKLSAKNGDGFQQWIDWLKEKMHDKNTH